MVFGTFTVTFPWVSVLKLVLKITTFLERPRYYFPSFIIGNCKRGWVCDSPVYPRITEEWHCEDGLFAFRRGMCLFFFNLGSVLI